MQAALVDHSGATPTYGEIADPQAGDGLVRVRVSAASLSPVTKSRAAGTHYSSTAARGFVPGVDGVGRLDDGRRVWFAMPQDPYGALAPWSLVDPRRCVPVPDGVDDVVAAAIAIPGMSAWAALQERARFVAGGTVLVNGATGTSGGLAVQVARRLGAARVIATGRNPQALERLAAAGADAVVSLAQPPAALAQAFATQFEAGVDVVLDYLWGPSAETALLAAARAAPAGRPLRFVQIGAASASDITLPGAVLRSSSIELLGSGMNSVPFPRLLGAVAAVLAAAAAQPFDVAIEEAPLARVGELWDRPDGSPRIVLRSDAAA